MENINHSPDTDLQEVSFINYSELHEQFSANKQLIPYVPGLGEIENNFSSTVLFAKHRFPWERDCFHCDTPKLWETYKSFSRNFINSK